MSTNPVLVLSKLAPIMEAAQTSSIDLIQFAVIVLMALERIIKGFTASPCRHIICKSCCSSFEIEMASHVPGPRLRPREMKKKK